MTGDDDETGLPFDVLDQIHRLLAPVTNPSETNLVSRDPLMEGARLLQRLDSRAAGRAGLLLVVDDAHLTDRSSLAALTFTLRRLHDDRVMSVLIVREEHVVQLPPGLLRLIADRGMSLSVHGFDAADVSALLQRVALVRCPPRRRAAPGAHRRPATPPGYPQHA